MSHSGDHFNNPEDEDMQGPSQLASSQRRKRGPTKCKNTTEAKEFVIEFTEEGHPTGPNRLPYSNWVNNLVKEKADIRIDNWKKVKNEDKEEWWQQIKAHWNIKDDTPKQNNLKKQNTLKIMNEGWKQHKSTLVTEWMNKGRCPVGYYQKVTQPIWDEFVALKQTPEFKEKSERGRRTVAKNLYPHHLGSGGYEGKSKEWESVLKSNKDSDSPVVKIANPRGTNWLMARSEITADGKIRLPQELQPVAHKMLQVEDEVTSGVRTCSRENDSLSQTLDNPEHPGRVRGVSVYKGFKDVFHSEKPKRRSRAKVTDEERDARLRREIQEEYDARLAERMAEMEARMEARIVNRVTSHQFTHPSEQGPPISPGIRRSSQASGTWEDEFDNLKVATKCDLIFWSGAVPITVAKGLVHPGQTLVHHAPVGRGYACVEIDSVVSEWRKIPLPVPTEDMLVVDDIRESFIQWPKNQIILDQEAHLSPVRGESGMVCTADVVGETDAGVQPEAPDRRLISPEEYKDLPLDCQRLHDRLMKAPEGMTSIVIETPPGMFLHDGWPCMLSFDDFKDFLYAEGRDRWLDCSFLTIFAMKLLRTCESWSLEGKVNNTAILDPGKLNFTVLQGQSQQCVDYMCYAMHRCLEDGKKFILLPYHQRTHWCLFIIIPTANRAFIMDSARPKEVTPEESREICPFLTEAWTKYVKEGGLQGRARGVVKDKFKIEWLSCARQNASWECAYYTMIFMFNWIERTQFSFPKNYSRSQASFSHEQINEIRAMWARWFVSEFCKEQDGFV